MTGRRLAFGVAGALVAAFLGGGFFAMARVQVEREQAGACLPLQPVARRRPAPEFTLPDRQGRQVALASLRGKVVFLNFWLSSCQPCEEEMPGMERLRAALAGRDFEMVAITADERWDDVERLVSRVFPGGRTGMTILQDAEKKVAAAYGTKLFPETYLIDREGNIRFYFPNARDWGTPAARACVESLLRER